MATGFSKIALSALAALAMSAPGRAELTAQQAERIRRAVPEKARVAPKKPRRVLIWNTPFMEKSPHKGYSIPQAEHAMKLLGQRTGAFAPVVSDDVAIYLPENLEKFDAVVMNNSNGPWIAPTDDGRVFYSAFGHRTEIWWNPAILRFYLDGIQFATGDLDAPAAPK
jgi:hypothetical protein